jgi:ADP-heptose:LPS heptosyltransferase
MVFRALQLGDMLCAVPALRALRASLPNAEIDLAGLPWAGEFATRFSNYIDGFCEFPGFPGLPEREPDVAALPDFLSEMQSRRYDLAIQMHGNGRLSNSLVGCFGAKSYASFHSADAFEPDPGIVIRYPEGRHEIHRNLALIEALGFPSQGDGLEFPITPKDYAAFQDLVCAQRIALGKYVCIHPGGRSLARRWRPEAFAAVARAIASDGYQAVFTGTNEERELCDGLAGTVDGAISLAGRTSLGTVAALIESAELLICNDTGVSHIACAVETPSVVVVTNSEPARWAPLHRERHRVLLNESPGGATPGAVIEAARALLGDPAPERLRNQLEAVGAQQ